MIKFLEQERDQAFDPDVVRIMIAAFEDAWQTNKAAVASPDRRVCGGLLCPIRLDDLTRDLFDLSEHCGGRAVLTVHDGESSAFHRRHNHWGKLRPVEMLCDLNDVGGLAGRST
jgi:hypothetical protein